MSDSGVRRSAKVLVIDDSPLVLHLLRSVFEGENYDVLTAEDGHDGFEKVRRFRPDLIVTDTVMPGVDGFALVRKLKEDRETGYIPVIMLTASDTPPAENAASAV